MDQFIVGRNSVMELLQTDAPIEKIYIQKGDRKGSIHKIYGMAKDKKLVLQEVSYKALDEMSDGANHQGVIAMVGDYKYYDLEDLIIKTKEAKEQFFYLILENIQDPHNFGAILRTCEVAGVNGIIIPKRRAVGVTPTVTKTASGATNFVNIAKVTNISDAIDRLKKENIWIYGAAGEAEKNMYETDLSGDVAIVIGNEGFGMTTKTKDHCDALINIPVRGQIDSLNASSAAAVILFEAIRQNNEKNK